MSTNWQSCMQNRPRFQWERSSGPPQASAANNCGPTGSSQQADFYNNRKDGTTSPTYGIEATRLKAGVEQGRGTSAWEQAEMCNRRGVPSTAVFINDLPELDALLGKGGKRPIGMGWLMSRVTAATRGHSFLGWHRVTILTRSQRLRNGVWVKGYVYTDPNFNPAYRPDPRKGHRFISRRELKHVLGAGTWSIVPNHRKLS